MDNIDRLASPGNVPNEQDLLRSRVRTTGITETVFGFPSPKLRVFDVGGARSERKKWPYVSNGVHRIVFCAPLSGYDECLIEDATAVRDILTSNSFSPFLTPRYQIIESDARLIALV